MPSPFYNKLLTQILAKMKNFASSIKEAIYTFGVQTTPSGKSIFAFEVDGKGKYSLYDDSNLPSLISLPYLEFIGATDPLYQRTRSFLLSHENKYYYESIDKSPFMKGIGSSHTNPLMVWPLAVIAQALTSSNET